MNAKQLNACLVFKKRMNFTSLLRDKRGALILPAILNILRSYISEIRTTAAALGTGVGTNKNKR